MPTNPAIINLASLNGLNGFKINGVDAIDLSGRSVASAGDVNGDGFDDILIGAFGAAPSGDNQAGESYVVFGKADGFGSSFDLSALDGNNGFRLDGINRFDKSGFSVSSAGDVNGDGFDDIIIGAPEANRPFGFWREGVSYVVFGKASGFADAMDLSTLNGNNGFNIVGAEGGDESGYSVSSAGDVNGDGFDDLLIGAHDATVGFATATGHAYVVFGKPTGLGPTIDLSSLNGVNGFRVRGAKPYDELGFSVSAAGDVNGDGLDDILIGAPFAGGLGAVGKGESYLIFGKAQGFTPLIQVANLNGTDGFRIPGVISNEGSGRSVSAAGDVNGDGIGDLLIGATGISNLPGRCFVVFGHTSAFDAMLDVTTLNGVNGFRIDGIANLDRTG